MSKERFSPKPIRRDTILGLVLGGAAGAGISLAGGLEGVEAPIHYLLENILGTPHPTLDQIVQTLAHHESPGVAPAYPGGTLGAIEGATIGLVTGTIKSIRKRLSIVNDKT